VRTALALAAIVLVVVVLARLVDRVTASPGGTAGGEGRVVYVVDGDTVHVVLGGDETIIRVIGIDTPEVRHGDRPGACFGDDAARFARAALLGRRVHVTVGVERRDRYGRTLATLVPVDGPLAGRDLSEALAAAGLARPLAISPNTADAPRIAALVAAARRGGKGLWSACGFAAAFPGKTP
jgi:micrococcal nuclease